MVSFPQFKYFTYGLDNIRGDGLTLQTRNKTGSEITLWRQRDHTYTDTYLWEAHNITVNWRGNFQCYYRPGCFEMLLSFHPRVNVPQRLSSGLYNCSVEDYRRFQQHLDCNLKVECEDGRDEGGHCPFSSPACQGWVASGHKCFKHVSRKTLENLDSNETSLYKKAVQNCGSMNASLAAPYQYQTWLDVFDPVASSGVLDVKNLLFGLSFGDSSVPSLYRSSLITHDRTVLHHPWLRFTRLCYEWKRWCFGYIRSQFVADRCESSKFTSTTYSAICESRYRTDHLDNESETVTLPILSTPLETGKVNLTRCGNGQLAHAFLECSGRATSAAWFSCDDEVTRVYYTLVCDFRQDCHDGSDESFCQHPPCDGFTCTSGQCVPYAKRCNVVSDCTDDSDEVGCSDYDDFSVQTIHEDSPVLVNFDGICSFINEKMRSDESCPDTHYRCPGKHNDCLPVFTRCNGWYDCIEHEDEERCEEMACPGFYRCFNSTVCTHTDHLCDGWPHCPRHDDEWLCDMTCPSQCQCHGHAFLCPRPFSAHRFPQLRYLDAGGSGMTLTAVKDNPYIMHLVLRLCSLTVLPVVKLLNLQSLDVSSNKLQTVDMSVFVGFKNLRRLSFAKNPIKQIVKSSSSLQQTSLRALDLSHTKLTVLDCKPLSSFLYLQTLNLSFTTIHTVDSKGFQHIQWLTELYLKGSPVKKFPANLFKPLSQLRIVSADTYKLCCKQILPDQFDMMVCDAPKDEISSCEDLLQTDTYRVFLWLIGFLSLLGNVFCLVMRVCVQRSVSVSGFLVFVSNLSMADLLMGVYIAIIGVSDEMFRGEYLHYDETWTHSVACKVAGFLSLLSSEVSALTIWLITLDRFIVLRFPFSRVRFQRASAAVACLFTWFIGCLLAFIPLLPVTSHWEFYSQTGICIPLPVTRRDFKGKVYSVSVFIVLNFVLFLFIATGQAFIYWSVQKNAMKTETTKSAKDLTIARRLISVAVTDFLCWFPIGLCGLLASADTPISGEVNVALAIFVLPLNSALNPFVYTFNTVMEKRRKSKEAMLFKWLKSQSDLLEELQT